MDKVQMIREIDSAFLQHISDIRKSVRTTQEMTRDAPGRIESRYDTSREETGWLATGQAAVLEELERSYAAFRSVGVGRKGFIQFGAYFEAESIYGGYYVRCFVCPGCGGFECETSEGLVTLISLDSPIAQAALGCIEKDVFVVNRKVDYVVRKVA